LAARIRNFTETTGTPQCHLSDVLSLTAVALIVRSLWLPWASWDIGDSTEYLSIASGILSRHAYTSDGVTLSSYRPPLYPALIALAASLTGHPVATVLGLQVVLSALRAPISC
jgi:hypothetical protein